MREEGCRITCDTILAFHEGETRFSRIIVEDESTKSFYDKPEWDITDTISA